MAAGESCSLADADVTYWKRWPVNARKLIPQQRLQVQLKSKSFRTLFPRYAYRGLITASVSAICSLGLTHALSTVDTPWPHCKVCIMFQRLPAI
jgi:hypothetical protein